ncbi:MULTISPECIES: GNAT family N-acetyltransferase [Xanthomonas]|uniref:GNAT family N-acetyltransferase n=1 Tax=Xanthomonas TaxID=338 RepID=UPI001ADCD930|nr:MULTISPECIES: GNAT family N-acetyltransferase [unclassified Xanthomonas]MBO9875823.1 GNAT family N-acetyltransferase [Xanthomonas sp. D-93]WNH43313.1 GNAT family N-acetyltransferase [Xanthomonas sp. A6251]
MSAAASAQLRPAVVEDIPVLWALRTRCVREVCSSHYAPEVIARWCEAPAPASYRDLVAEGGAIVAEDGDGSVLGFGVVDEAGAEIDGLFVDPSLRGSGLGRRLLQALEQRLAACPRIHVAAALNAVAFYRAQGYVVVREGGYPHPSGMVLDCVFMEKIKATG